MKISTKGRYALRLMTDVAAHDETGYVSLKDVAARQNISPKYLEQIAGLLAKAGMLRSGRGAQGGYRLAKEPAEILRTMTSRGTMLTFLTSVSRSLSSFT